MKRQGILIHLLSGIFKDNDLNTMYISHNLICQQLS